jgi:hypothetical protein
MKHDVLYPLLLSFFLADLAAPYSFAGQSISTATHRLTGLNRQAFYKAMEEDNQGLVKAQLEELKSAPEDLRQAFMGAMLMKRAGLGGTGGTKLQYFKEGHRMLEGAIKKNPDNTEFRFLRLMIQEHAPGVLGYKGNIEKDCAYIRKNYKSLPDELQQTIEDYNKKSRFLKLDVS